MRSSVYPIFLLVLSVFPLIGSALDFSRGVLFQFVAQQIDAVNYIGAHHPLKNFLIRGASFYLTLLSICLIDESASATWGPEVSIVALSYLSLSFVFCDDIRIVDKSVALPMSFLLFIASVCVAFDAYIVESNEGRVFPLFYAYFLLNSTHIIASNIKNMNARRNVYMFLDFVKTAYGIMIFAWSIPKSLISY